MYSFLYLLPQSYRNIYESLRFFKIFKFIYQTFKKMAVPYVARQSVVWWRERDSNPRCPFRNIHDFQSCSFNHSDTSPIPTPHAPFHSAWGPGIQDISLIKKPI